MVKNILALFFVFAALTLAGCATNIGVYDPSVPQEQLCTLKIDRDLFIKEFDGNTVKWSGFNHQSFGSVVEIPAGSHHFLMNYSSGSRYVSYASGIRYRHTFEAGKTYVMKPAVANGRVNIEVTEE